MTSTPIGLSASGPPETVLPEPSPETTHLLLQAESAGTRDAAVAVVAAAPRSCEAWAMLGERTPDGVDAYAAFRVGYHRGLDNLRGNGWKGSGYVRWVHPTNRGFLRCLAGLARQAAVIGETDEAERCELFLRQCDPSWPPDRG
jgi:Protein of unknown function (DUF3151)